MDLKIGDEVTIVLRDYPFSHHLVHTKVRSLHTIRGALVLMVSELPDGRYYHNEGISWCRGHSGEDVDALQVALALR